MSKVRILSKEERKEAAQELFSKEPELFIPVTNKYDYLKKWSLQNPNVNIPTYKWLSCNDIPEEHLCNLIESVQENDEHSKILIEALHNRKLI